MKAEANIFEGSPSLSLLSLLMPSRAGGPLGRLLIQWKLISTSANSTEEQSKPVKNNFTRAAWRHRRRICLAGITLLRSNRGWFVRELSRQFILGRRVTAPPAAARICCSGVAVAV